MAHVVYHKWECPVCLEVCEDPNDFRITSCHNGHVVQLGHAHRNCWQEAYLHQPMPYIVPHMPDDPTEEQIKHYLMNKV